MNRPNSLCRKGFSFLLTCSLLLLFSTSSHLRSSDGATLQQQPRLLASAALQAEYQVVVLTAPAGLTDTVGLGVGAGQAVGTGRIAGSAYPEDTHALLWKAGSTVGLDLHPANFRFSAALDTDGQ